MPVLTTEKQIKQLETIVKLFNPINIEDCRKAWRELNKKIKELEWQKQKGI